MRCRAGRRGPLLAAGFPDRIAARRPNTDAAFRLAGLGLTGSAGGQGARLGPTDPLRKAPLLAVAELELQGTEARIRMAAPLDLATLERRFPERLRWEEGAAFDARAGAVLARRRRMFGPLVLEEHILPAPDAATVAAALARAIAERGFRDLDWSGAATQLRARLGWLRRVEGEAWPDTSDAALVATAEAWLAPQLHGLTKLSEAKSLDLVAVLRGLLPWDRQKRLDAALPARVEPARAGPAAPPIDLRPGVPTLEARAPAPVRDGRHAAAGEGGCRCRSRALPRRPARGGHGNLAASGAAAGPMSQGHARPLPEARLAGGAVAGPEGST
jgi:ATP-dependent helicase HrpB